MLLRLQEEETQPSRLRLVIAIEQDTVKLLGQPEVVPWIRSCQQWLEQFHLREFPLMGEAKLFSSLNDLHDAGASFAKIANSLNGWIADLLREQVVMERLINDAPMAKD